MPDPPVPIRRLGKGGMGEVWLAQDPVRGLVALKRLHGELAQDEHIGRFRAEFATLSRLHHPNLVQAWDYFVDEKTGAHAYSMELVEGLDFTAATGGLLPEQVCALAEQVCDALEHVHSHDLVHGDVKAGNIIVTGNHVRLMDFGLADHPGPRPRRGSLDTLAPEIIQGRPHDRRADLYALGAVLFEALTRHPPFQGPSRFALLRAHLRSRPAFPARLRGRIPESLQAVILRLLNKNPSARFFTAAETAEALRTSRGAGGRRFLSPESLGASTAPFGRTRELDALEKAVREAASGAGPQVRVLSGAPGSGKAALLRGLRARLASRRIPHATAACTRNPIPLSIVRTWLEELAAHASPEWPRLRAALSGLNEPGAAAAAAEAVDLASRRAPVALFIENAEWADSASLEFVAHLRPRRHARIALIAAVTPGEGSARWEAPEEISIDRISPEAICELACAMTGATGVDPALGNALNVASGGIPGAARSCLRSLAAAGALFIDSGTLLSSAPPATGPELARILEFLSTDARLAAEALAVSRAPIAAEGAAAIAGLAPDRASAALFDLEHRGIAVRDETRTRPLYRLRAPGLSPVILANTPRISLVSMHRAAAGHASARLHFEDTAHHLFAAGGGPEAVAAALKAAAALVGPAPAAAAALLQSALLDPSATPGDCLRARRFLAGALLNLEHPGEAGAVFLELAASSSGSAAEAFLSRAAGAFATADPNRSLSLLSSLPPSPENSAARATALLTLGRCAEAAAEAGLTPDSPALRLCRARAALALGRAHDALSDARLACESRFAPPSIALQAAACAAEAASVLRDLAAAAAWTDRAATIHAGSPRSPAILETLRARLLELRRHSPDAVSAWRRAVSAARSAGADDLLACAASAAAALLLDHDRLDEASQMADAALQSAARTPDIPARCMSLATAARVAAAIGRLADAERLATEGVEAALPAGESPLLATLLASRAAARLAAGRVEDASLDHEAARRAYSPAIDPVFEAEAALARGDDGAVLRLATRARLADPVLSFRLADAKARALLATGEPIGIQAAVEESYDVLSKAREIGRPSLLLRAHLTLGNSLAGLKLQRSARDHFRAALDLLRDILIHVPAEARDEYLALPIPSGLRRAILSAGTDATVQANGK